MKRVHALISGRVQGVFFRVWTKKAAKEFGISGWVRNLPDGRVEIMAEGSKPKLEKFLELVKSGPRLSRVENIDAEWGDAEGLPEFEINH